LSSAPWKSSRQLVAGQDLRLLVAPGRPQGALEPEHLARRAGRHPVEDPLDGVEVEAVSLHLIDQLQPGDVLPGVVTGSSANLRGGQEAPRLMGPDISNGDRTGLRQLVNGVFLGVLGLNRPEVCAHVMDHNPM